MLFVIVLLAIAFFAVLAIILLRKAGGGKFPWLQFYLKGRESGFVFHLAPGPLVLSCVMPSRHLSKSSP